MAALPGGHPRTQGGERSSADDPAVAQALAATRVFLRPIADPMSLGFLGLAGATLTAAGLEIGWIPPTERLQVGLIVAIFAPLLQTIASVFGYLGRDAVVSTGNGVLAGTWAVIGITYIVTKPGSHSPALGTFLMVASLALMLSAATATHGKLVPAGVLGLAAIRFAFTGGYDLSGVAWVKTGAGIVGCLLAAAAVYAAVAFELEGQLHRAVLPTLRRHRGRRAYDPYLVHQVDEVATESGVRTQL